MNPLSFFKVDKSIESSTQDHLLSIIWLYFMLFPTGTIFNVTVPLFLLLMYDPKQKNNKIVIPLIILTVTSVVFNLGYDYMDFKVYARCVEIFVCFFTFASLKGRQILFPYIWFALFYILLSQISAMYIPTLYAFFDKAYHITESMMEMYQTDMGVVNMDSMQEGTRLGGMYLNPNNCASYITVLYALGLSEIRQLGSNKKIIYLFVFLVFLSFYITGSRTSLICFLAISGYYLYSQGYSMKQYVAIGIVAVIFFFLTKVDTENVRMFDVESGMSNSFGSKMDLFWYYITHCTNPIQWIFGGGDLKASGLYNHAFDGGTDCDFGNIFIQFGVIFWILYWRFYYKLFRIFKKEYRVLLFTLLWSFSNSLLISYRMCPVWLLCLGLLYRKSIVEQDEQ